MGGTETGKIVKRKSGAHKNPKLRIAISDALVRRLICKFQTRGTGRTAKVTSVTMFTTKMPH